MRPFLVVVIVLLAVVVMMNGLAAWDRARHEARIARAASAFRPGLALLGYRDTDERRFQKARLAVIPRPRIVAFGSSRVMTVSTAMVNVAPDEFYNAGLSGGTVEDFIVLWSLLRDGGKAPDVAVFAIDAWLFNESLEQVRWLMWADEVARFMDAGPLSYGGISLSHLVLQWYRTKEFVSFSVTKTSVRELQRRLAGRRRQGSDLISALDRQLVRETHVEGRRALRADGSLLYERAYVEQSSDDVRRDAISYAATELGGLRNFRWNAEREHRLEALWTDLVRHRVAIVAYIPPYHPAVWAHLAQDQRARMALAAIIDGLRRLSDRAGAQFVDLADPAAVPCSEREFYDGVHASEACTRRVLGRALRPVGSLTPRESLR